MAKDDPVDVWQRPERSGVGPKPGHSRHGIALAAIGIADRDGLTSVSTRSVAASIGAGAATLYRYLKSHDELVEIMMDTASAEYDLGPSSEPPGIQLLNLAHQGRAIMHRHPWLAPLLLTRPSLGPNTLRYLERALAALQPVDLPGPAKMQTVAMLTAITSAYVQNELAAADSGNGDGVALARSKYVAEVLQSGDYPLLANALAGQQETGIQDKVFAGVITNYLAGAGVAVATVSD